MMVLFLTGLAKSECFLHLHLVMEMEPVSKTLNLERPKMMDSVKYNIHSCCNHYQKHLHFCLRGSLLSRYHWVYNT